MKLADIRKRVAYNENAPLTQKQATRLFLSSKANEYEFAVTLTIKQNSVITNNNGTRTQVTRKDDLLRTAKKFTQKLNRLTYGRNADYNGKGMKYFAVVEGERTNKLLHLHLAVGNKPANMPFSKCGELIRKAANLCELVNEQVDVQIMDSGWMEYITKEVGSKDTDNVLWQVK
jgi:hypothetical protein